jgi:DNA-binding MarR family transcriptional regulator
VRQRDSLLEAMVAFRSISKRITVSEIIAFLYTCENEGLSVQEFAYIAGFSQSAASRNLRALGRAGTPWALDPALGLIEPFLSPSDARSHVLHLTDQGKTLRERLDQIIAERIAIKPA